MTVKDFTVGEDVYVRRRFRYPELHYDRYYGRVTKVGRKYITVLVSELPNKFSEEYQFALDKDIPDECGFTIDYEFTIDKNYPERCICPDVSDYEMFKDETMVAKFNEHHELVRWFCMWAHKFNADGLSLEQLKQIRDIVEKGTIVHDG